MVRAFEKPFRLLYTILRHGKWAHSGLDFGAERARALRELQAFIPSAPRQRRLLFREAIGGLLSRNSVIRNIIAQLGLAKAGLSSQGGHLHLPFVNISYIRIPKAASTSMSMMMLYEIYPGLKHVPLTSTEVNFLADANLRKHISPADPLDVFFTVVRNPYARIVSVYRDFFLTPGQPFIYEDYLFGILSKEISFREFVYRVSIIPKFLKDQHLRSQHEFVDFYVRKIPNVLILKLEELDQVKAFCSIYNLELPHLNRAPEPYDYRQYYDTETFHLVTTMYRKDLRRFNYANEVRALRTWLKDRHGQSK